MDKSILDLDELFKIKPNSNIWHIDLLIENLLENKKKHKKMIIRIITNNKGFEIKYVYQINNFKEYKKIIEQIKEKNIIIKKVLNNDLQLNNIDFNDNKSFKIKCSNPILLEDPLEYFELTAKLI